MTPVEIQALGERLRAEVRKVIVGHDDAIDLFMMALLCNGHVLLEGVPGTAKTLLARSFASALALAFNRIQFTPDLMPGDVLGTNLFNFQSNTFSLVKGPIFTDLLLADEINRTPPKTQAALLQAMQEQAVSIDGKTHPLGAWFLVIATQNPIEQEGTYPLPEAQLDRFMFKIPVGYPSRDEERAMVRLHGSRTVLADPHAFGVTPVADGPALSEARAALANITLADPIIDYAVDIVRATRQNSSLLCGASPRSTNMLTTASRAAAALDGREFVVPDDVKRVALPALRHRILMSPSAEIDGIAPEAVIGQVLAEVPAPR